MHNTKLQTIRLQANRLLPNAKLCEGIIKCLAFIKAPVNYRGFCF